MFSRTPAVVKLKLAALVLLLFILNITSPFLLESASVELNLTIVLLADNFVELIKIVRLVGDGAVGVLSFKSVKQIVTSAVFEVVASDTTVNNL